MIRIQALTRYFIAAPTCLTASHEPRLLPAAVVVNGESTGVAYPTMVDRALSRRGYLHWFGRQLEPGDFVELRDASDSARGKLIFEGVYAPLAHREAVPEIASLVSVPDWVVDTFNSTGSQIEFSGWILSAASTRHFAFRLNGALIRSVSFFATRSDVLQAWEPVAGLAFPFGFMARAEVSQADVLEISLLEGGDSACLMNVWFPHEETFPLPEASRRERVYGYADETQHRLFGFTSYRKIAALAGTFLRFDPGRPIRILDWGCGCARIGRYLLRDSRFAYTGVDIDWDNIEWCKKSISADAFDAVPLLPPTRLADESFDVIFGISVFSHLHEASQTAWLREIARLLSPAGIGIFTILGAQAVAKAPAVQSDPAYAERGFVFFPDESHQIGHIVGDRSYYGTAFHHYGYVQTKWAELVDIVAYIPAGFSHQDIVVVSARK